MRKMAMSVENDAGYDIFFPIRKSENIDSFHNLTCLRAAAQKIHIFPDLAKNNRHAKQKFVALTETVQRTKRFDYRV